MIADPNATCVCGAGCSTIGACLRAKGIRVGYCQSVKNHDRSLQRAHDRETDLYRDARRQGIQPAGTTTAATRFALELSDRTGQAFDAGKFMDGVL